MRMRWPGTRPGGAAAAASFSSPLGRHASPADRLRSLDCWVLSTARQDAAGAPAPQARASRPHGASGAALGADQLLGTVEGAQAFHPPGPSCVSPPPPPLTAPAANRLPTLTCSCFALSVLALDNGQGLRPAMGFNSKQLFSESLPPPAAIDPVGPSHNTTPLLPLPLTIRSLEHLCHQH